MTAGVNTLISRLESANTAAESSATPLSQTFAKNKANRNFGGTSSSSSSSVTSPHSKKSECSSTTMIRVGHLHKPPMSPSKSPSKQSFQLENREQTLQMLQAHSEPKLKLEVETDDSTFGDASASEWSAAQMTTGGTNPAATTCTTRAVDPNPATRKPNLVKSTIRNKVGAGPSTGTGCSPAPAPATAATAATANASSATRPAPDRTTKVVRKTSIKASELGIKLSDNSTPEELEEAVKKWKADRRVKQQQQQQQQQANTKAANPDQKPDPDGSRQRSKSRGRNQSRGRSRSKSRGRGERSQSRGRPRVQNSNSEQSQSRGRTGAEGGGGGGNATDKSGSNSTRPNPSSSTPPGRPSSRGRPRILHSVSDTTGDSTDQSPGADKKPKLMKRIVVRRRSLIGSTPTTAAISEPGTEPVPMEPASELASCATPLTTSTTPGNDITNTPPTANPTGEAATLAASAKNKEDAAQLSPPAAVKHNPVPSWEYLNTPPCAKKKALPAVAAVAAPPPATDVGGAAPSGQNARIAPAQRLGSVKRSTSATNSNIVGPSPPPPVSSSNTSIIATGDALSPSPEMIQVRRASMSITRSPVKSRIAAAALDHAEIQKRMAEAGISHAQYLAMLKVGLNITLV